MGEPAARHQKRFEVAVNVIQSLPKSGCYKPSYRVMLRFYSLYKQAVCGPCTVPRPSFWDPVGRYKWDAWNTLGDMSHESAMVAYVEEMKKVAQEVIDTVAMDKTTASFFHYFKPLYAVIDDMPRPPDSMFRLTEHQDCAASPAPNLLSIDDTKSEVSVKTIADSECTDIIHDSDKEMLSDTGKQLSNTKSSIGSQKHHVSSLAQHYHIETGSGLKPEGLQAVPGSPKVNRDAGERASYQNSEQLCSRRGAHVRRVRNGRRGQDRFEKMRDVQFQQQVVLALQRLGENTKNVLDALEAQSSEWRSYQNCGVTVLKQEMKRWWPFESSGWTLLLLAMWPFVAHGLVYLLRRAHRRTSTSSWN